MRARRPSVCIITTILFLLLVIMMPIAASAATYLEKPLLVELWSHKERNFKVLDAVAWSPDSSMIAVGMHWLNGSRILWEVLVLSSSGKEVIRASGRGGMISSLAWSPSSDSIAALIEQLSGPSYIVVVGLNGSVSDAEYKGVTALDWGSKGMALAFGDKVKVVGNAGGWQVSLPFRVTHLEWVGDSLLAYGRKGVALLRDGEVLLKIEASGIGAASASARGYVAVAYPSHVSPSRFEKLVVYRPDGSQAFAVEKTIDDFAWSPDGGLLAVQGPGYTMILNLEGETVWKVNWGPGLYGVSRVGWRPSGGVIYYLTKSKLALLDSSNGTVVWAWDVSRRPFNLRGASWSPDGRLLAVHTNDNRIIVLGPPAGLGVVVVRGLAETSVVVFNDGKETDTYGAGIKGGSLRVYATPGSYTVQVYLTLPPEGAFGEPVIGVGANTELVKEATLQSFNITVRAGEKLVLNYDLESALHNLASVLAELIVKAPPGYVVKIGIYQNGQVIPAGEYTIKEGGFKALLAPSLKYDVKVYSPQLTIAKEETVKPGKGEKVIIEVTGTGKETGTTTTQSTTASETASASKTGTTGSTTTTTSTSGSGASRPTPTETAQGTAGKGESPSKNIALIAGLTGLVIVVLAVLAIARRG